MSYLHCHSCDWSQDDFWTKKYNPLTKFIDDIKWLYKPRIMSLETYIVNDLIEYTKIPILRYRKRTIYRMFSWNWLILEFVKEFRIFIQQKWWTFESWKKNKYFATCPRCGARNFDID